MGYFKSISIKKKKQRRILKILLLLMFFLFLINYISYKINISTEYLENIVNRYFGMNFEYQSEIKDIPVFKEENKPIIYLYNTHQTENYKYDKITSYNIDYSVMFASYILESYLEELGIPTIVETTSMSKVLKENGLKYKDSYKASRLLLEQRIIDYPSLTYFVDLHRDSSIYEKTTCEINGKNYARILFVIGLEHDNYEENKKMAVRIQDKLKQINPCLSRGILEKAGEGVDGKYNQDFNGNTILLEIGGQYNQISEANNTLKVLASILYEYIMEDE